MQVQVANLIILVPVRHRTLYRLFLVSNGQQGYEVQLDNTFFYAYYRKSSSAQERCFLQKAGSHGLAAETLNTKLDARRASRMVAYDKHREEGEALLYSQL